MAFIEDAQGNRYYKPNMAALEGEWGRRVMQAILDTPAPNTRKLERETREVEDRIRKAKANGTY